MRRLNWRTALVHWVVVSGMLLGWATSTVAQRRPIADTTLGAESSRVIPLDPNVPVDLIQGGARRGSNLFHSFREFHVETGRGVYFADPGVTNILGRVTGGNPSQILGVLGVLGNANLFLVNPSGIIFGPNARLDVRGSFTATTANAVQFENQGFFSATNPTAPALLTVQPSAFLFNQVNPASIVNNSRTPARATPSGFPSFGLRVPAGESLTLLGGNISMNDGGLIALGGRVEVGGLSQPGTVTLNADGGLGFPTGVARADVSLNRSLIDVAADGGGSITVNAGNFNIFGSALSAGIGNNSGSIGAQAGDITLNASAIRSGDGAIIRNRVGVGGSGNAGNINITTNSLSMTNGARLNANTQGQGNAGNVVIHASDRIALDNSAIFSTVGDVSFNRIAVGNGGDIRITTGSLSLTNGAVLVASTLGQGSAGNVVIHASDRVSLDGADPINPRVRSAIFSSVGAVNTNRVAEGNGGDIRITTGSLSLTNGGQLAASTLGQGSAGNVVIHASDRVTLNNGAIFSSVGIFNSNTLAEGNGGDIRITTGSLSLTDGAQLNASTLGQGNAGNVIITASDRVSLEGGSIILSTVGPGNTDRVAEGEGGDIRITTASLSLTSGSQLVASTVGQGNAGNVIIDARDHVSLDGADPINPRFFSSILSTVGAGNVNAVAKGEGGDIRITTASLSLTNGARLSASTQGQGNAGNVVIHASDRISLTGLNRRGSPSEISTATLTGAQGRGGDVNIVADSISLADGAKVSTATENRFPGGNVIFSANTFEAIGGAQVITATSASGQAGNIIVNAADRVTLAGITSNTAFISDQGAASGLYAGTARNSSGQGGTIEVTTGQLEVSDRARIAVNSQGSGSAGNIDITADRVRLTNQSRLTAETTAGDGGNITLRDVELLLLRNGSLISTTAGTDFTGGNGGNITIDATFIVAVLNENSDIRANAFTGSGGNVRITSRGLFGIAPQPRDNPRTSDITASSERGVQGTVAITTPDVDPRRGLDALSVAIADASTQITQTCSGAGAGKGEFVVTGRGGLPSSPTNTLIGDEPLAGWATLDGGEKTSAIAPPNGESTAPLVEAQKWIVGEDGVVQLVAVAPSSSIVQPSATCP